MTTAISGTQHEEGRRANEHKGAHMLVTTIEKLNNYHCRGENKEKLNI